MKNNRGFTLIELILYIALVSIFISAAITFAWDIIYGRAKSQVQLEVLQNLKLVSQKINYEIRSASAINSVTATSLSLASLDAAHNPTVIDLNAGAVRIGYGADANCPSSSPCSVTSNLVNVSSLTFSDLSTSVVDNIAYSLTIEANNLGGRQEWQFTKSYRSAVTRRSN